MGSVMCPVFPEVRLGVMSVTGVRSASGSRDDVTEPSPMSPGV